MRESSQPTVMSVSTLSRPTCLPARMAAQGDLRADLGDAGGVDDHVDGQGGEQGGVVDGDGAALGDGVGECVVVVAGDHVLDAGGLEGAGGALEVDVGDGDDLHAGDLPDLRDEPPAHLPGADQTDPHGSTGAPLPLEKALTVCHFGFSYCCEIRTRGIRTQGSATVRIRTTSGTR